jgi:hypothetical protein
MLNMLTVSLHAQARIKRLRTLSGKGLIVVIAMGSARFQSPDLNHQSLFKTPLQAATAGRKRPARPERNVPAATNPYAEPVRRSARAKRDRNRHKFNVGAKTTVKALKILVCPWHRDPPS